MVLPDLVSVEVCDGSRRSGQICEQKPAQARTRTMIAKRRKEHLETIRVAATEVLTLGFEALTMMLLLLFAMW